MRLILPLAAMAALAACHCANEPDTAQLDARASAEASAAAPASSDAAAADAAAVPTRVGTPAPTASKAAAAPLPGDVSRLVERIEACEHFAGEDPYDEQRGKFLREQIEASCPGNKAELARLRDRYARDPAVLKRLAPLDPPDM